MAKKRILIFMLVVGLLLIGSGLWLWQNLTPKVKVPAGSPAIAMTIRQTMRGARSYLAIYEDGTVINTEDSGLRFPSLEQKAVRVWKVGKLTKEEFESLVQLFKDNSGELKESYSWSTIPQSDMDMNIVINYQDIAKMVRAQGYLSTDSRLFYVSYPDMPSPLKEVYDMLRDIAWRTKEVASETIS